MHHYHRIRDGPGWDVIRVLRSDRSDRETVGLIDLFQSGSHVAQFLRHLVPKGNQTADHADADDRYQQ